MYKQSNTLIIQKQGAFVLRPDVVFEMIGAWFKDYNECVSDWLLLL
jgi:hypothetical protein